MCAPVCRYTRVYTHVWMYVPVCVSSERLVCACVCLHIGLHAYRSQHVRSWGMWGWRAPGSRRESDRRPDLPQPPAPGACFPACGSCEPVNSSYINSCCLLTYCRERRSWPQRGLSTRGSSPPPHRTWEEGKERWALRPTQAGRQGQAPALASPNPLPSSPPKPL